METFVIADTEIHLGPDASGEPVLRIQATPWGAWLTQLLADAPPPLHEGFYRLPHAALVDRRICALTELFIAARYAHPQLLQLRLLPQEAPA